MLHVHVDLNLLINKTDKKKSKRQKSQHKAAYLENDVETMYN